MISPKTSSKLGIIAANGVLPQIIINHCYYTKRDAFILRFKNNSHPIANTYHYHYQTISIGKVGKAINLLKLHEVTEVILTGYLNRPSLLELNPDLYALKILATGAFKKGDNNLLSTIIKLIEKENIKVIGIKELIPSLLTQSIVYSSKKPSKQNLEDIKKGIKISKAIGEHDVGQGCVVQNGLVIALEAIEGTKNMLDKVAELKLMRKGNNGVLIKSSKPNQELRVDLPTIGPDTIYQLHKARCSGVALEANKTIILEQEKTIALANKLKIFIAGF